MNEFKTMTTHSSIVMTSILIALLGIGSMIMLSLKQAKASEKNNSPIVVELYTSQSCSSCPPADKLLQDISKNKNVIVLSCHVSYWNRLNWVDTLSHEFCDIRQHGYASLTSSRRIFTPQMMINGINSVVGSHTKKVKNALLKASKEKVQEIQISEKDNMINFELPDTKGKWGNDFRLWMYGYKKSTTQNIESGENSGKTVTYTNSATTYNNLGAWQGKPLSKAVKVPEGEVDGVVIFGQAGGYGRIIAAGQYELKK